MCLPNVSAASKGCNQDPGTCVSTFSACKSAIQLHPFPGLHHYSNRIRNYLLPSLHNAPTRGLRRGVSQPAKCSLSGLGSGPSAQLVLASFRNVFTSGMTTPVRMLWRSGLGWNPAQAQPASTISPWLLRMMSSAPSATTSPVPSAPESNSAQQAPGAGPAPVAPDQDEVWTEVVHPSGQIYYCEYRAGGGHETSPGQLHEGGANAGVALCARVCVLYTA